MRYKSRSYWNCSSKEKSEKKRPSYKKEGAQYNLCHVVEKN